MTVDTCVLITAEEFFEREDQESAFELIEGRIVRMPPAFPQHGKICARIARLLGNFADDLLGHVMSNDVCIVTGRNPDTVRGADVVYLSYSKVPKGRLPAGCLEVSPELVIEVRSPSDRWPDLHAKTEEYLESGVQVVCVVDPSTVTAHVYRSERTKEQLGAEDTLKFEDILAGFSVPVKALFE